MHVLRHWLQAARPLAQVNIAVPLLVGEALAFAATGQLAVWPLVLTHLLGVLDHLFIVFANDVADEAGDRKNTTFNAFSGGSRVLVQGKLQPAQLRRAAAVMAVAIVGVAVTMAWQFDRPHLLGLWGSALLVLWAYSFAPLRLAYRGFGALAQGLGVGVLLPLIGWYSQTGDLGSFPWPALAPLFLLGVASNITTALPDAPADAEIGKLTWPVRYGPRRARKHSLQLIALAAFMTPFVLPDQPKWIWAALEAGPVLALLLNLRQLDHADPEHRSACTRFIILNGLAANLAMLGWAITAFVLE